MSQRAPIEPQSQANVEPIAPEEGVEDIEIDAEDAEAVTGGQTSAFLWVGSRAEGAS